MKNLRYAAFSYEKKVLLRTVQKKIYRKIPSEMTNKNNDVCAFFTENKVEKYSYRQKQTKELTENGRKYIMNLKIHSMN